ncbi:MAG: hypothetical protein ACXVW0_02805 [Nocardioides sp.]
MTTPRPHVVRRTQAALVGLGVAGAVGVAVAVSGVTSEAADPGASDGSTVHHPARAARLAEARRAARDRQAPSAPKRTRSARPAPQLAPQPAPGGSHATSSGS